MKRVLPAIGLFLLAPLVAEFLLGDLPITAIAGLLVVGPMYGGGALLIRELCRRFGWGWPGIVTLGLAYAFLEEGAATQSLFNPHYAHKHLLSYGHLPALGMGASWTVFVLTLHAVWSIGVPIACVELLTRDRRSTPWLGRLGLGVAAGLLLIGLVLNGVVGYEQSGFVAAPGQFALVAVVVIVLVAAAVVVGRRPRPAARTGTAPSPWLLGAASLVVTSVVTGAWYEAKDSLSPWVYVVLVVLAWAAAIRLVGHWSRLTGWGAGHQLALAAGALLTYAWEGFVTSHMLVDASPAIALASHLLFAAGAVLLIVVAAYRVSRAAVPMADVADVADVAETGRRVGQQ
ncbi:MAG: hypothetical protein WCA46_31045 [Actinocatenispora sp.]